MMFKMEKSDGKIQPFYCRNSNNTPHRFKVNQPDCGYSGNSKIPFAGTDAKVLLNLGTLGNFELNTSGEDDFEMGTIKSYEFKTNFTIGELRKTVIELGHDNSGKNPGWCVGGLRIEIILQDSEIRYMYKLREIKYE